MKQYGRFCSPRCNQARQVATPLENQQTALFRTSRNASERPVGLGSGHAGILVEFPDWIVPEADIERAFRTVKEMHETLYHFHKPQSEEEANTWLLNYLVRYNEHAASFRIAFADGGLAK